MEFVELKEEEFYDIQDSFVNSNYLETTMWAKVKRLTNWKCSYVGLKDKGSYVFATLILWKKIIGKVSICYAPRGFLGDYSNANMFKVFTENLHKYLKEKGAVFIKIDPLLDYSIRDRDGKLVEIINDDLVKEMKLLGYKYKGFTTGYSSDIQYRWSYEVCVNELDMDKRCRRCIRKSNEYPLIVRDVNEENIDDFKAIMESTSKRHGCFDRTEEYYKLIKSSFKDNCMLKVVYLDKKKFLENFKSDKMFNLVRNCKLEFIPITCGLFMRDVNGLHYVYGGNIKEYMYLMGCYKLMDYMILYAKGENIDIYDFGGISGIFDKSDENYGVYEFKRGFGGYVREYVGEADLVIRKVYYVLFNVSYYVYKKMKNLKAKLINL